MSKLILGIFLAAAALMPLSAQSADVTDFKSSIVKHLKVSEEFTLKVADAMPAENYDFKLTPEQMSFGEQMSHLSRAIDGYSGMMTGQKPSMMKPTSMSKTDVMAFVKSSFAFAIAQVESVTPEQIAKSYGSGARTQTGYDLMMAMLNHTTNHRASAEMYLRVKGITPPQYQF